MIMMFVLYKANTPDCNSSDPSMKHQFKVKHVATLWHSILAWI